MLSSMGRRTLPKKKAAFASVLLLRPHGQCCQAWDAVHCQRKKQPSLQFSFFAHTGNAVKHGTPYTAKEKSSLRFSSPSSPTRAMLSSMGRRTLPKKKAAFASVLLLRPHGQCCQAWDAVHCQRKKQPSLQFSFFAHTGNAVKHGTPYTAKEKSSLRFSS